MPDMPPVEAEGQKNSNSLSLTEPSPSVSICFNPRRWSRPVELFAANWSNSSVLSASSPFVSAY